MIIKNILGILKKIDSIDTSQLFGRYSSRYLYKKMAESEARRRGWKPKAEIIEEAKARDLNNFYRLLSFLHKKRFIQKIGRNGKNSIWKLTKRGLEKFFELDVPKDMRILPMQFDVIDKGDLKVVVFDIPEKLKYCRDWLRQTLVNLGFSKLQKSVWLGSANFPEEFIYNLRKLNIIENVHVFTVKDKGTVSF